MDAESQTILTQGIANKAADGSILHDADPVSFSQVVGVPVLCVPYLGYVNDFVTTPPGVYIVVVVVACWSCSRSSGGSRTADARGCSMTGGDGDELLLEGAIMEQETSKQRSKKGIVAAVLACCLVVGGVAGVRG